MATCEWCGKNSEKLNKYIDAIGDEHNICDSCKQGVDNCECRKCGETTDPSMMIDGLCTNCIQVKMHEKSKKEEAVRMGVDKDMIDYMSSEITFTDKDYESWVTLGNEFSPENIKNSMELRKLWIIVKLNSVGIYDIDTITKCFGAIETILDRNLSKLINNKCRIIIGNTPETRKVIRSSDVIDYEDEVYIIAVK